MADYQFVLADQELHVVMNFVVLTSTGVLKSYGNLVIDLPI